MNVLFVNYGDFTSNSINHISGFARELTKRGHTCMVAVPGGLSTLSAVPDPAFLATTFEQLLEKADCFPDGRPADILHAWTPRESVRRFVLRYRQLAPSRIIVHLEDNEEHLVSQYMETPFEALKNLDPLDYPKPLVHGLPHPTRYRTLLRLADGVTIIVPSLRRFVPAGISTLGLPPGVDFEFYRPLSPDSNLRAELGLRTGEKVIVYTGSNTFANEQEILQLYLAVQILNQRGVPTRLIRTGINSPQFLAMLPSDWATWTLDLGFIDKNRLPVLLSLSDVLVQPGKVGDFNDYRLPSKLPEFLASGRPVITVASNIGLQLQPDVEALVLPEATSTAIADACQRIFDDPDLALRLGTAGRQFALQHFDLGKNTSALETFYQQAASRPGNPSWVNARDGADLTLLARQLRTAVTDFPSAKTPAWQEILALVDDFVLLSREIETFTQRADSVLVETRASLEHDREEWKRGWALTDQHAKNLESTLKATDQHAKNLERTLQALQADLQQTSTLKHQAETLLKGARQQLQAFEQALALAEATVEKREREIEATETALEHAKSAYLSAQDHIKNLEHSLSATQAHYEQTEAWRQRTEASLKSAHEQIVSLDSELAKTRYQLAETRARALALGDRSQNEIQQLRIALRDTRQQRDDLLQQRDHKIRSMQRSFSWQVTAPLRTLRRLLIDPFKKPATAPQSASPAALPDSAFSFDPADFTEPVRNFRYSVDYPQSWSFGIHKVVVRGWCLTTEPVELKKIRARVGTRQFPGVYGLKRMDVLAAMRNLPQAEYCGYKIDVLLEDGDEEIILEVADTRGVWHRFFQTGLKVGPEHGQPELTSYERWAVAYDQHTPESLATLRSNAARFTVRPLISVVMPVYHRKADDEVWLKKAIESVRAQVYENWELCIADDASPAPHVRPLLEEYQRKDSRIKVVFREKNGHISAASNSALELAQGEFTALLDHDDELAPHAFYEVVSLLAAKPDTDLIYSDEDKIDEEGRRHEPYFKPDFLPDLFTGQNYLSHLSVYRTELIRSVSGFRIGYEGSQDWDLALRVVERTTPERIRHIPKVLYHWRAIPGSTAMLLSEKNYPLEAARRALTDHFARQNESVELITVPGDHWRVKRPIPAVAPLVSLVIPSRNGLKLLSRCVDSLLAKTDYPNFEIIIVDNGSDDPETLAYLKAIASDNVIVLRYDVPFNYSAINNFGVKHARGEIIGLLNNDLEFIHADWLTEMVSHAVRPQIGCVGAMLYYPNETIQHAGVIVGLGGVAGHGFRDFPRGTEGKFNRARLVQNYSSVTAACLLVRRSLFEHVGGLDEGLAVAFNDIDFCLKVQAAGYRNLWTPFAECYHHESASRGAEDTPEKHERFRREVETMLARWKNPIAHDPAYNPNLSLEHTDFSLAAPPRAWIP